MICTVICDYGWHRGEKERRYLQVYIPNANEM